MLTDLRLLLSDSFIRILFVSSLIIRLIVVLFFLPNSASALGPDEGTYASLAEYVEKSLPVSEFPNFGPGLYESTRTMILPSSLLIKFGLEPILSVRVVSTIFGFFSLIVFCLVLISFQKQKKQTTDSKTFLQSYKFKLLTLLYAFLPSNFVWSLLGLRESTSQFFVILTFYLALKLTKSTSVSLYFYAASLLASIVFSFGARQETALVFCGCLLIATIPRIFLKPIPFLVVTTIFGIALGLIFTSSLSQESNLDASTAQETTSSSQGAMLEIKKSDLPIVKPDLIPTIERFSHKQIVNSIGANSSIPPTDCRSTDYFCILTHVPFRWSTFLFRPLPVLDDGSNLLKFASLENTIWVTLIFLTLIHVTTSRREQIQSFAWITLLLFVVAFSFSAAMYEGNLGTAFRHKSTILWPLLILISNSTLTFTRLLNLSLKIRR